MKKFFHRFSTVDKGGIDTLSRQRNEDLHPIAEKTQLHDATNNMLTNESKAGTGDRVKALAARFENFSTTDQHKLQRRTGQLALTPRSSSNRQSSAVKITATKGEPITLLPKSLPLPPPNDQDKDKDIQHPDAINAIQISAETPPKVGVAFRTNDESPSWYGPAAAPKAFDCISKPAAAIRDESSIQQEQPLNIAKTVAFAPSPKKPTRPSSPPPPMPVNEEVTSIGNFAKATLASTARSKLTAKQQAHLEAAPLSPTVSAPQSPSVALQTQSRPSSSLSTSRPQPRRSVSSTGPGRKGSANDKGIIISSKLHPTASATLGYAQGQESLPNSIPFTSAALETSHLRSGSPQSIKTNSSRPAGYGSASNLGSRRSSWNDRVISNGSASQGWTFSGAKSIGAPSWSEMTQEDLVSNLGARERTRQEVLWEIVASEERYVKELERTKEYFLDALLQPLRMSSPSCPSTTIKGDAGMRLESSIQTANSSYTGIDYLGMNSSTPSKEDRTGKVKDTASSPRMTKTNKSGDPKRWSNGRLAGQSDVGESSQTGYANVKGLRSPVQMPTSLRITLEAISDGLLQGHQRLSEALKQRYEEQWPLVRSLADIFTRYADVLKHYKDYVMHLERALESLEEAALMERAMRGKRLKKEKLPKMVGLGRAIALLESAANEKGECSLAISLAMPFQRLLKYPLLFQNLLFHTDASTYEFESTVKMVVDVEQMIRSIEDGKVDKEERDKTLDGFARIEGMKEKALLKPKRDRMLIEERALYEENPRRAISESNDGSNEVTGSGSKSGTAGLSSHNASAATAGSSSSGTLRAALKSKRSYRRLSDFLTVEDRPNQATKAPNMGSKKDLWLIRFSDVELKCQRVGITALPMVSSILLQQQPQRSGEEEKVEEESVMTEEEIKIKEDFKRSKESKERMKALRNTTLRSKTRNLYKFISVTNWKQVQKDKTIEEEGALDGLTSTQEVDEEGEEDCDGEDEEDDDRDSNISQETDIGVLDTERYVRQSKLSFSYWGHDKVEPKPISRTQSQHGSSVSALKSRELPPPLTKRHSLTSTATVSPSTALSSSSKVVTSNAQTKSKADKFGNRLRQTQEGVTSKVTATTNEQRASSSSRLAGTSQISIVEGVSQTIPKTSEAPLSTKEKEPSIVVHHRANLPHDYSVDSNLRLISSLIDDSDGNSSWQ